MDAHESSASATHEGAELASAITTVACRSCGGSELIGVLDLGRQPLANALRRPEIEVPEETYPLRLACCPGCSLVQIIDSIAPEVLFDDYPYFSSVSPSLVEHARGIAMRMLAERALGSQSLVVELASNDGYLLQHYRDAGVPVLGVEPAKNIAAVAESRGIPTYCAFFGRDTAIGLAAKGRRPDVLHANNVLAHVPDLNGFVAGIALLLGDRGQAVIEVPYVKELLDNCEFDTIYHEHLCYFSLTAVDCLFRRHGLVIEDVERIEIHGGSLRIFAASENTARPREAVGRLLAQEREWGVRDLETYAEFSDRVMQVKQRLKSLLAELKEQGSRLAAYGAAAKGSTLLNTFGIGRETLDFVADASPHKQGYCMPGSQLPIVSPDRLVESQPDYVLLLAWNFAEEIFQQQKAYRELGGRFIIPVPEPRIV